MPSSNETPLLGKDGESKERGARRWRLAKIVSAVLCLGVLLAVAISVPTIYYVDSSQPDVPVVGCPFDLHKEKVFARDGTNFKYPLDVCYARSSDMCGAAGFSQPRTVCQPTAQPTKITELAVPERSFGIELELVTHEWKGCDVSTGEEPALVCMAHMHKTCLGSDAAFDFWEWGWDPSVLPLTEAQAAKLDVASIGGETKGFPFELDSPPPPHALSGKAGFKNAALVLDTFKAMGVQAGPTAGMHVHVNVGMPGGSLSSGSTGTQLSTSQIANVWTAYVRFQLVIDQMTQDSRVGGYFSRPMILGRQCVGDWGTRDYACMGAEDTSWRSPSLSSHSTTMGVAAPVVFRRLHGWMQLENPDDRKFVEHLYGDYLMGDKTQGDHRRRSARRRTARRTQFNLEALTKYGTIEFRGFPATYDSERMLAWTNFILHFVEHFKDCSSDAPRGRCAFFSSPTMEDDLALLTTAQATATMDDLASELGEPLLEYFRKQSWINGSACGM